MSGENAGSITSVHVHEVGCGFEVLGVHAIRYFTEVIEIKTFRDGADKLFIDNSMTSSFDLFAVDGDANGRVAVGAWTE